MTHLNTHNVEYIARFKCDLCDYKGVDNWNLKRHKQRKHQTVGVGHETLESETSVIVEINLQKCKHISM